MKSPVIFEFISRISRFTATSFLWKTEIRSPAAIRRAIIHSASRTSVMNITTIAKRI